MCQMVRCLPTPSDVELFDRQDSRVEHVGVWRQEGHRKCGDGYVVGDIIGSMSEARVLAARHSTSTLPG